MINLILPLLKAVWSFFLNFIRHFDNNQHKVASVVVRTWAFGVCFLLFPDVLKNLLFYFFLTWDLCLLLLYCSPLSSLCSLSGKNTINNRTQAVPSSELPRFTNTNKHNFHSDELHKTKQKTPPRLLSILCCVKSHCSLQVR